LYDVFICHASEDKEEVARPIAEALKKMGLRVWYDEYTLKLGDNLRRKIDQGLRESTYGIVILSKSFFVKEWPQKELDGLNAREKNGKKVIIPIWYDVTEEEVRFYSPMLADRFAARIKDGMRHTIDMIIDALGDEAPPKPAENTITDKIVRIEAEKDSFVIGNSISFIGSSVNCGDYVHLVIFGPGKYSKGIEIATPPVSHSNTWNFQWLPDLTTLPGTYTATVFGAEKTISDEVLVKAERGFVSIVAQGDGSYYIGEKINISGVCTTGKKVYIFLKGPDATHQERKIDQLDVFCQNGNPKTFLTVDVRQDRTWSYVWDTKKIATQLEDGFYRIYALDAPVLSDCLSAHSLYSYGTVSIMMRLPFISGTVSQSVFAKGDPITITGTAEGVLYHEIIIWIFGEKDTVVDRITVNLDASYIYEIPRNISKKLEEGQYFAIIQHPMLDDEFSVYFDDQKQNVLSDTPNKGTRLFLLSGESSSHGYEAIKMLISALNNPTIDDEFIRMAFIIEPPKIHFNPIDDKKQGETFVVTALTNLRVNDEIFMDVFSSNGTSQGVRKAKPFSIGKGSLRVIKGDEGINKITFEINTTSIPPGEYLIKASAMDIDISSSTSFKIN
jgi:hypothetical protein